MSLDSILRSTGKNLVPYPYTLTSQTKNGVTITVNSDGSITCNGTCTSNIYGILSSVTLNPGTYTMSNGAYGLASATTFHIYTSGDKEVYDNITFTVNTISSLTVRLAIYKGYTCDNLTLYPQIELGSTATSYEPYQQGPKKVMINGDKEAKKITYGSKNLIPFYNRHGTQTNNGITYTIDDSIITANGTVTDAQSQYFLFSNTDPTQGVLNVTPTETFYFSGCPVGGSTSTYYMEVQLYKDTTYVTSAIDIGNGILVHRPDKDYNRILFKIYITKDTTVNNLVFKPQLEFGTKATEYVKYNREVVWEYQDHSSTWLLNDILKQGTLINSTINFTSNNINYSSITLDDATHTRASVITRLRYDTTTVATTTSGVTEWVDEAYRTITFETEPTGALLTWLQNNATKQ